VTALRLPDFMVIGAMRAGSTSLYRYIGAHPDVYVAPKELQFFTEHFDRGLDWYAEQFSEAPHGTRLGEATADYLARKSAMTRIAETLPDVKLIASLRNPVDRAYSHYGLLTARGRETRTFAQAIGEEIDLVDRHGDTADGVIYLSHSMYDVHLARLGQLFSTEQLFVSIFERMVDDPQAAYAAICRFIQVEDGFVPEILGRRVNPYVTFRSLWLRDAARTLPTPLGTLIARLNTRRGSSPEPPDQGTVDELRNFFAPRIAAVERRLGIDLPEWG